MLKGLIITHGELAKSLVEVVEKICGSGFLSPFCVPWDEPATMTFKRLEKAIISQPECHWILFTDLYGGTPTNVALEIHEAYHHPIITGVNIPLLIKFVDYQKQKLPVEKLSTHLRNIVKRGQEGIQYIKGKG